MNKTRELVIEISTYRRNRAYARLSDKLPKSIVMHYDFLMDLLAEEEHLVYIDRSNTNNLEFMGIPIIRTEDIQGFMLCIGGSDIK